MARNLRATPPRQPSIPVKEPVVRRVPFVKVEDRLETPSTHLHLHWTIIAHVDHDEQLDQFRGAVTITVEADSELNALYKSMEICIRPYYFVRSVDEICPLMVAK